MCDKQNFTQRVGLFLFLEYIGELKTRIKATMLYEAYFGQAVSLANRSRKRSSTNSGFNANKILRENNDFVARFCGIAFTQLRS